MGLKDGGRLYAQKKQTNEDTHSSAEEGGRRRGAKRKKRANEQLWKRKSGRTRGVASHKTTLPAQLARAASGGWTSVVVLSASKIVTIDKKL